MFLSVYTPTYKRPGLLARCVASVEAQSARADIQHVIVRDEVGIGIGGMFAEIPRQAARLRGLYVYVLQDDDRLAGPEVVAQLRAFARENGQPPVIMVKNRKRGNVYPSAWGERPTECHVDLGSFVVRRDVFLDHCGLFGKRYQGDFDFIDGIWQAGWKVAWCDLLFAEAMALGLGREEAELVAGDFSSLRSSK